MDITFGKQKFEDTEQLMEMNQLLQQNKESQHRLASTVQADSKVKYQDSIEDTEKRYQKLKQAYKARQDRKQENLADNSIKYAYVVFRSMGAMEKVRNEYNLGLTYRYFYMYFCCCCDRAK